MFLVFTFTVYTCVWYRWSSKSVWFLVDGWSTRGRQCGWVAVHLEHGYQWELSWLRRPVDDVVQ